MKQEDIMIRALDSDAYKVLSNTTDANTINPTLWSTTIEQYAKEKLSILNSGAVKVFNDIKGQAGQDFRIPFNAELTAAAVAETASLNPQAIAYTLITVTPSEVGGAFQITKKESVRSAFDVVSERAMEIGHALGKAKVNAMAAALTANTDITELYSNVTVETDLASTDLFNTDLIADGIQTLEVADRSAKYIWLNPRQVGPLRKDSQFVDASEFGSNEVVQNGQIGRYLGVDVYTSTLVPQVDHNSVTAYEGYMFDDSAIYLAPKQDASIRSDDASTQAILDRSVTVAFVEDYAIGVLQAEKIVRLVSA